MWLRQRESVGLCGRAIARPYLDTPSPLMVGSGSGVGGSGVSGGSEARKDGPSNGTDSKEASESEGMEEEGRKEVKKQRRRREAAGLCVCARGREEERFEINF